MPRLLFALLLTTVFVTTGFAAPALAAEDAPPPPPPYDWSDVTGGPVNPDLEVGEEMC